MTHHLQLADKTMISQTSGADGAGEGGGRGRGRGRGRERGRGGSDPLLDERDALLDDAKRESEALTVALTEPRQKASKLQTELERERIAHRQAFQIVEAHRCLSLK